MKRMVKEKRLRQEDEWAGEEKGCETNKEKEGGRGNEGAWEAGNRVRGLNE